jgi:uncharacterized protein
MNKQLLLALVAIAGCSSFSRSVLAQGPSFRCASAGSEVETMVCNDAALAALDRKLADTYQSAKAKAQGRLATQLRADQRGWVKDRDECWKAAGQQSWITATWTVNTVRACVDAKYRLRTSELEAVWQLLPSETIRYACQNKPANELLIRSFATDPATLRVERGDRTVRMWRVGPERVGRYEGRNVSAQRHGKSLQLSWLDTNTGKTDELMCEAE